MVFYGIFCFSVMFNLATSKGVKKIKVQTDCTVRYNISMKAVIFI